MAPSKRVRQCTTSSRACDQGAFPSTASGAAFRLLHMTAKLTPRSHAHASMMACQAPVTSHRVLECTLRSLQLHISHTYNSFAGVAENMARLARLGLQVHVTELDVTCPVGCDLEQQAHVYRQLLRVCLEEPAYRCRGQTLVNHSDALPSTCKIHVLGSCTNFETWGFTDKYTWKGSASRPLPFDSNFGPKPVVAALLAEFANHTRIRR